MDDVQDDLTRKIKVLNETLWEHRVKEPLIREWLDNFRRNGGDTAKERLHALYMLSNIMYFGFDQMRELLRALYRDLYRYPIIERIRRANGDTTDQTLIAQAFSDELQKTLFLGVGNPSESGSHLLYYFRQENDLRKTRFTDTHQLFRRDAQGGRLTLRFPDVKRYVFIDDFCGTGTQGTTYLRDRVSDIKKLDKDIVAACYVLFATSRGIEKLKAETKFDEVACVYELDSTFKCFDDNSRYFADPPAGIDKSFAEVMSRVYGLALRPSLPLGYDNCQLLLAFHHNTPDNTLPIIWCDESGGVPWTPVFRRYSK